MIKTPKIKVMFRFCLWSLLAVATTSICQSASTNLDKLDDILKDIAVKSYFPELRADWTYEKPQSSEPAVNDLIDLIVVQHTNPENQRIIERRLLKFLNSEATLPAKQFACKCLRIIGTEESVTVLAGMLTDPQTSDMARYALEGISGTASDQALWDALKKANDKVKVGIINTLSNRGDTNCTRMFENWIYDSDTDVAQAAVDALGQIGDIQSTEALASARSKTSGILRFRVCNAGLMCAEKLALRGQATKALEIYKQLYDKNESLPIRVAALWGMVKMLKENAAETIRIAIKDDSYEIQEAAIASVREVKGTRITEAVAAELPNLSLIGQVQLLSALGIRRDAKALPAVIAATKSSSPEVRIEALKALQTLGDSSVIGLLAQTAATTRDDEQRTARTSLYRMQGKTTDADILKKIDSADSKVKAELITAIGQRVMTSAEAIGTLFALTTHTDDAVRLKSLSSLGMVAGQNDLPKLVKALMDTTSEEDRAASEEAIISIAFRITDKSLCSKAVVNALASVTDTTIRCRLISLLGRIGSSDTLDLIAKAFYEDNPDVQKASLAALSDWPNSESMANLLNIIKTTTDNAYQHLALSGYIKLIGMDPERPAEKTVALYRDAMSMASEISEKRLVISELGETKSHLALQFAAEYLDDSDLQQVAEAATVNITKSVYRSHPQQTKAALNKVIKNTKNDALRRQAQEILTYK